MSRSAKSVLIFGIYLVFLGLILLLKPNLLLNLFGIASTSEVWVRVTGLLLLALSVYYIVSSFNNLFIIFKVTAYIRCTILFFFSAFWLAGFVSPTIILFSLFDFLGG